MYIDPDLTKRLEPKSLNGDDRNGMEAPLEMPNVAGRSVPPQLVYSCKHIRKNLFRAVGLELMHW